MSKPPSKMERLIAGITLFIAFLVMASVFAPARSQADQPHAPDNAHAPDAESAHPTESDSTSTADDDELEELEELESTDAHEGLSSMGTLDSSSYTVEIFAGKQGPLYSIIDARTGEMMGTLLSADKVQQYFPDVSLPALEANEVELLMLAE